MTHMCQGSYDVGCARNREFGAGGLEIVRLDRTFPLFFPDRTLSQVVPESEHPDLPRYTSSVILDTDGLMPQVPMKLKTSATYKTRTHTITPFDPAAGYQIDRADFG